MTNYGVTNVNKPEKVGVVFDAAAQFDKTCLNEKLLKGPDYLNKLIGIIFRFRQEPYIVISDIEQMYLQIKVAEKIKMPYDLYEEITLIRKLWTI